MKPLGYNSATPLLASAWCFFGLLAVLPAAAWVYAQTNPGKPEAPPPRWEPLRTSRPDFTGQPERVLLDIVRGAQPAEFERTSLLTFAARRSAAAVELLKRGAPDSASSILGNQADPKAATDTHPAECGCLRRAPRSNPLPGDCGGIPARRAADLQNLLEVAILECGPER